MPPKAKGKKDGPAKFADKENLARAETEVLSLQRLLELRSHEVRRHMGTAMQLTMGSGQFSLSPCLLVSLSPCLPVF